MRRSGERWAVAQFVVSGLAAVVLIVALTILFLKDGRMLRDWIVCLLAEQRRPVLRRR